MQHPKVSSVDWNCLRFSTMICLSVCLSQSVSQYTNCSSCYIQFSFQISTAHEVNSSAAYYQQPRQRLFLWLSWCLNKLLMRKYVLAAQSPARELHLFIYANWTRLEPKCSGTADSVAVFVGSKCFFFLHAAYAVKMPRVLWIFAGALRTCRVETESSNCVPCSSWNESNNKPWTDRNPGEAPGAAGCTRCDVSSFWSSHLSTRVSVSQPQSESRGSAFHLSVWCHTLYPGKHAVRAGFKIYSWTAEGAAW